MKLTSMGHLFMRFLAIPLAASSLGLGAATVTLPLPEMAVPKTSKPPTIDGELKPGEWDQAAACTGFVKAFDGTLSKAQSTAWITYDDKYLYVAFRNYRSEKLALLSVNGRRPDDDAIVADPSNEIWITPATTPATTYQTVVNAYPAVLDVKMIPSLGFTSRSWSGRWEVASRQSAEGWTIEARAPIAAFGFDHIADGAVWRALFATDVLADGTGFRAWAPGGAFADIPRHGFLHFTEHGPAFQLLDVESLSSGRLNIPVAVSAGDAGNADVAVTLRFGSGVEATAGDTVLSKTLSVASGRREEFVFNAGPNGSQRIPGSGFCTITARSGNTILYHQVIPYTVDGYVRRPPAKVLTKPYQDSFGLEASYAPLSKQLVVKIDRYYMPNRTSVSRGRVELRDPKTGTTLAERPISPFWQDYSEFPLDLTRFQVPIATDLVSPPPVAYQLQAVLSDHNGHDLATVTKPVKLEDYQFSWLPNNVGISDKVIAPWGPVRWEAGTVSLWNKRYVMTGAGLAEKVTNSGVPQLTGPMRIEAVVNGAAVTLSGSPPTLIRQADAFVELQGASKSGPLTVDARTRIEFDGFVWNTMTIQPTAANVGRVSLVVDMPESEAPSFVTTSGGWSSYFGWTPDKWDSRESSLTSMVGNFVPYVFLTDSFRGFSWFADNTKGWRLDPTLPTEELRRHDGLVTLRVNFINKAGPIEKPLTMQYGWMITPQKAQPRAWRGYLISSRKYFPQATPVFWNDADRNGLWAYYSSPFPKDYQKSRAMLENSAANGVVGCVGNIAHSIGRYVDYHGRQFYAVAADWGLNPGSLANGDVARSRGPNDFQVFHFDYWSKQSDLGCLYFDENYLSEDWNYLSGGAYLLPDERVQPGYSYLGLREFNKRLRYMFAGNAKQPPNLWEHTTGGQAVYAWMPDVSMEGENVEPTSLTDDYMEALPASRLRSIGMGNNLGSAPFIMCQATRHRGPNSPALVHQFVGWVLAHDALPEQVDFWPTLASELELWREDVRFLPYWRKGLGIDSLTAGVVVSAHVRPRNAVLWVVNENRTDSVANIRLDPAAMGLDPKSRIEAYDAENGARYAIANGVLTLPVPKRMWRAVRLVQPRELIGKLTFVADFESEVAATEAYGGRYPLGATLSKPIPGGKTGKGAPLDQPLVFLARHHVSAEGGMVSFAIRLAGAQTGTVAKIGDLALSLSAGRLVLTNAHPSTPADRFAIRHVLNSSRTYIGRIDDRWHQISIEWRRSRVRVSIDCRLAMTALLSRPLVLPGMGRGLEIRDLSRHIEPATITFGAIRGAVLDDLQMGLAPDAADEGDGIDSTRNRPPASLERGR